jgi:hypothetical protein
MQVREAKDFLVRQAEIQAGIDGVPLTDDEKRLMYFSESEGTEEEPEPEGSDESQEDENYDYEGKISTLLRHAYRRVKRGNTPEGLLWDQAIHTLRRGDHYLIVLWGHNPYRKFLAPSFWKLLGLGILVLIGGMFAFLAYLHHAESTPYQPNSSSPVPVWSKYLLLALLVGSYLFFVLFPRLSARLVFWFSSIGHKSGKRADS